MKVSSPTTSDEERAWFERHQEDLVAIGRTEGTIHGRGVIIIAEGDRPSEGNFDYRYAPSEAFIAANPQGLGAEWADVIRAYDIREEAVCALVAGQDGPFTLFVVVTVAGAVH